MSDTLDRTTVAAQVAQAKTRRAAALTAQDQARAAMEQAQQDVRQADDAYMALVQLYRALFGEEPA